ncbi:aluminum activated malate transporter-domain-containing protein [Gilbertella persicaria]|uniref:aluminum activated malate transporter-domain-containing protein n=1 Tax=Gilbertella persicaria TaxID=101096 RepID=UPI0022203C53|nr:aluminum activated malate transporter-domain-containing protein [Gilbertella persicaria]KAI8084098.1 aluminum activated malate transporter-domain-containing protein [Gilbertella persicaria]
MMVLNVVMMVPPAIFTGIISYLCTLYNRALITHPSLYSNGAGVIGAISFALCVFLTAYYRLKYPRLFIPALQGFTLPFFVLTRDIYSTEYNVLNVVNTVYPVLIGGAIALLCNLLIWPETAAKAAERSLGNSIESIKQVLSFVHQDLLKNDESNVITGDISASTKLQNLNNKLQKDIASMKEAKKDAKYEIVVSYYAPEHYKPLAASIVQLSHNLLGFSLSIKREVRIMLEKKVKAHLQNLSKPSMSKEDEHEMYDVAFSTAVSSASKTQRIPQTVLPTTAALYHDHMLHASVLSGDTLLHGREYKDIDRLQSCIQPSVKRFISVCIDALHQIEQELVQNKAITVQKEKAQKTTNHTRPVDLSSALQEFKQTEILLKQEYDRTDISPTEDHFLVYTVIYTLVEFGKELIVLQDRTKELISHSNQGKWWINRIHFSRVHWERWLSRESNQKGGQTLSERAILDSREMELRETHRANTTGHSQHDSTDGLSHFMDGEKTQEEGEEEEQINLTLTRKASQIASHIQDTSDDQQFIEPEVKPLQHAQGKHIWKKKLYQFNKWLQYSPTRYAFKFMVTTSLLSLMAFLPIPGVNVLYNQNHGQWALLSAMVVINYTVGSTVWQCFYRVIATIIGGVSGYICLLAAHRNQNPYVLAVMVLILQIPMWYLFLGSPYPRIGFISILTLAVITSTGYTNAMNESIFDPVWKRTITAIFAIIVVMLVNQLVWPVWARKQLRTSLADLLIATGIQYSRVASLVCQSNVKSYRYLSTLEECEANQKTLARQIHVVQEMLVLSGDEPRLTKGSFPIKEYGLILEHERNILYWIEHILKAQSFITESVRKAIMNPVNAYRKEMASAIHLYLFTLACALRTKTSLPCSLPSAEMARRMLQQKQTSGWKQTYEELCKQTPASVAEQQSAENQVFWHTYAAGSTEVVVEHEAMGEVVTRLMGQHVFKAATRDWIE